MKTTTLKIEGMSCGHCVRAVSEALQEVDGVTVAEVDLEGGRATVAYDETRTGLDSLVAAVTEAGYAAQAA